MWRNDAKILALFWEEESGKMRRKKSKKKSMFVNIWAIPSCKNGQDFVETTCVCCVTTNERNWIMQVNKKEKR